MFDDIIVGAGVIGLSLAYELVSQGHRVAIVDRGRAGREASWAGAGILPPANLATAVDPFDQLRGMSHQLHPEWAERLRHETGIDTGYRRCGAIYLARSNGEAAALLGLARAFGETDIRMRKLSSEELVELEPAVRELVETNQLRAAFLLPDEAQLRNPDHLDALLTACRRRGVVVYEDSAVGKMRIGDGVVTAVVTPQGMLEARQFCLTAGPWTYQLLHELGIETGILPIRGQIVLFRCARQTISHVFNEGPRYLVPRLDGRVLVGSTEEEVGFDKSTTTEALEELQSLARDLMPALRAATVERCWAGLRPATYDGLPYLGRVPNLENLFVAAGHFRSGLHLSTGTAVVMANLMSGNHVTIDLTPFRLGRG
jgi:glycine oxidase